MRSDCPILSQYNDIYDYALELFGKQFVTFVGGEIKIKTGNICLILLLSANEYKAYIHSFDMPKAIKEIDDVYYKTMKETGMSIRIMDRDTIKQYLLIKRGEHDFLTNNAE